MWECFWLFFFIVTGLCWNNVILSLSNCKSVCQFYLPIHLQLFFLSFFIYLFIYKDSKYITCFCRIGSKGLEASVSTIHWLRLEIVTALLVLCLERNKITLQKFAGCYPKPLATLMECSINTSQNNTQRSKSTKLTFSSHVWYFLSNVIFVFQLACLLTSLMDQSWNFIPCARQNSTW